MPSLTPAEAGKLAGCHPAEILRWVKNGVITDGTRWHSPRYRVVAFQINGCWEIDHDSLLHAIKLRKKVKAADRPKGVIISKSGMNAKIGAAYTTMAAAQTCPADCAFKGAGCYAEYDNTRTHWRRITAANPDTSPVELARLEAELIDELRADRDIRLHVAGDSTTDEGTRMIADAVDRYLDRARAAGHFVRVWGYTHAWRTVARSAWGRVSILASCESPADVPAAEERGYATALAAPLFRTFRTHDHEGLTVIPCPAQTHVSIDCVTCRLCFDDRRLRARKLTIGFETHGSGKRFADEAIRRVALPLAEVSCPDGRPGVEV